MDFSFSFKKQDWILNFAILFLALASLLSLLSAAKNLFYLQLAWFAIGFAALFLAFRVDWRTLMNYPRFIHACYGVSILLLILTYIFAPTIRGIRGWLVIGPLQFQAAELAKLALIIVFSSFWAKAHIGVARFQNLGISLLYFSIPALLVILQPDLGSVLILFAIWFGFLLVSGIRWGHLITAFIIFAVGGILLWTSFLADYQKERVLGLFYPERDPLGINYSVIQSKIAVGSAGFFGKGFGQGTQTQLGFLPEAQTDFILAAFTEEWGLLGGLLVIAAFLTLIVRIIKIGLASPNNFSKLICLGSVIMFTAHFVLNSGSSLGFLPVVGVPFPFLSYGGSNLLISFILIGMVQGIAARSKF